MAETVVNFMGGSPLNRLSWLRPSHSFLNAVLVSPATRWIVFNAGSPLIASNPNTRKRYLAHLTTNDVRPFLGSEPFFGQTQKEGEVAEASVDALGAARLRGAPLVFLGLNEPSDDTASALPSSDFADPKAAVANLVGTPFFSVDVAEFPQSTIDGVLQNSSLGNAGEGFSWIEPRSALSSLDAFEAGIFSGARSMVDWNTRNKFCAACGSPTYSQWAGWKLTCTSLLPWSDNSNRKPCLTVKGLHNFTHPRTDPVVIMIAIDETGEKILLGRNKKFPGKFYSAMAGFMEPGESFEDAVKREMWEEAGVKVWDVKYHSGQPWPYPANLMIGFYSRADSTKPVRTDLDNELEDARWYTREEVLAVLNHPTGTNFSGRDYKKMRLISEERINTPQGTSASPSLLAPGERKEVSTAEVEKGRDESTADADGEPAFRVPPLTAIAGVLINDWARGKIGFTKAGVKKGNL